MSAGDHGAAAPAATASLARTLQFGDSMFPIGSFAFSGGLESAVQKRVVTDAVTLEAYARTAVEQAAMGDGVALVWAHRAALAGDLDELASIDRRVYARKLSSETRTMSVRMGKKFAEMSAEVAGAPLLTAWRDRVASGATPGCYPVALAANFAAQGLPARDAFIVHQYGVATMILGAALRLMKIGHVETQCMLYRLNADSDAGFEIAARTPLVDMAGFAPLAEVLAAVHVKAHLRLFMN
ncbi:MAG TPA: urease accessory protein UreF [Burkholderiaceae bacterium]|nr:urease accessory protein UreF [Burkholderiaceae bacterium]HQR72170.1 urease accessory protein UreF [Burkholderiaceae bacterium]